MHYNCGFVADSFAGRQDGSVGVVHRRSNIVWEVYEGMVPFDEVTIDFIADFAGEV